MASLIPELLSPENLSKMRSEFSKLIDEILKQTGLTEEQDYEGLPLVIAALYGSGALKDVVLFVKGLHVLEQQISGLIETLNTYYGAATTALEKGAQAIAGANPGNTVNPNDPAAEQASIECARAGGFMLFGKCIKL